MKYLLDEQTKAVLGGWDVSARKFVANDQPLRGILSHKESVEACSEKNRMQPEYMEKLSPEQCYVETGI